jgi:hypothetical protein
MDDPDLAALRRLIDTGWTGVPIGNPDAPVMLVYRRTLPSDVEDELVVMDAGEVHASRHVGGSVLLPTSGTLTEVVAAATAWPVVGPYEAAT